jgi:hypothetical protein
LQERGPLRGEALKDGSDVGDHLATSCLTEKLICQTYRRCWRIPIAMSTREEQHEFYLTSCHSAQSLKSSTSAA